MANVKCSDCFSPLEGGGVKYPMCFSGGWSDRLVCQNCFNIRLRSEPKPSSVLHPETKRAIAR